MARTPSTMLPLGTPLPKFELPDAEGKKYSTSLFQGRPVVVMFLCNHCPFVKHIRDGLAKLGKDFAKKEISILAINSNDFIAYPDDSPALMVKEAKEAGYTFPYLVDESQDIAKAFHAACTPDFYLFNEKHELAYRGQFDDSRPGNGKLVTGASLREAIELVLKGLPPPEAQMPSLGCNIKWK